MARVGKVDVGFVILEPAPDVLVDNKLASDRFAVLYAQAAIDLEANLAHAVLIDGELCHAIRHRCVNLVIDFVLGALLVWDLVRIDDTFVSSMRDTCRRKSRRCWLRWSHKRAMRQP